MKIRLIILLIASFFFFTGLIKSQEDVPCTWVQSADGNFVAHNCDLESLTSQFTVTDSHNTTATLAIVEITVDEQQEDQSPSWPRFLIGQQIEVTVGTDLGCRAEPSRDSQQVTRLPDDTLVTVIDFKFVDGAGYWLVQVEEETQCWVNEYSHDYDPSTYTTWLREPNRVLDTAPVQINTGDHLIVQGVQTQIPCVDESGDTVVKLVEDGWATVLSVEGISLKLKLGYTDIECSITKGTFGNNISTIGKIIRQEVP